jgi:predicted HicB family RNase H-like nuclease
MKQNTFYNFRISTALLARIRLRAKKLNISASALIRKAITDYLDKGAS